MKKRTTWILGLFTAAIAIGALLAVIVLAIDPSRINDVGTLLYTLAFMVSVIGIAYSLLVIHVIAPNTAKIYGENDDRSKKWNKKAAKYLREKTVLWLSVTAASCVLALIWMFIKARLLHF